jgi:hypothetical protein
MLRSLVGRVRRMRLKALKPFGRGTRAPVRVSLCDRSPEVARSNGENVETRGLSLSWPTKCNSGHKLGTSRL